ncbi:MAG TPA: NPCBM/NEW2 domain-containing protein, partial [Thermomicrobiales bacterium]
VGVAGKGELRLVVTDGGDNGNHDHADWADARLECGTGVTTPVHLRDGRQDPAPVARDRFGVAPTGTRRLVPLMRRWASSAS